MADYTHLNLREDVENAAEAWGLTAMETRFARNPLGLQGGGFSYQRLEPGFRPPTAHRHQTHEEVYVVVRGSGRVKIEDEVRELRTWDVIRFGPKTARGFEAGPEGLELIAIGFGESGDVELLEDYWGD